MPRRSKADPTLSTRVLRVRLKDKHAAWLRESAFHVNQVFNYANNSATRSGNANNDSSVLMRLTSTQPVQQKKACRFIPRQFRPSRRNWSRDESSTGR